MKNFTSLAEQRLKQPLFSIAVAAVLALYAVGAHAMQFKFRTISDGGILGPGRGLDCRALVPDQLCLEVIAEGEIQGGDNERLVEFISFVESSSAELLGQPARVGKIFLDSQGGELREAMSIGRTLRQRMISVQVAKDSVCHSACVIALAGAVYRIPVGPIGVHAFYSQDFIGPHEFETRSELYNKIPRELEDYVREMRISNRFIDLINQTPHAMLKTLDEHELLDLGLAGIDPVYFQLARGQAEQRDRP